MRQPQAVPLHLLACSLLVGAPAFFPAPGMARAPKSSVAPSVSGVSPLADEEETFDEKLRQFGYWSGVALMCVQRITQLFGSDRAFFFAAAFGYGTSIQVDPARCKDALETFQQAPLRNVQYLRGNDHQIRQGDRSPSPAGGPALLRPC